jgi:hypothetical protein
MSMKALEWAMYDVPAEMTKGSLLRILLALADHADTEGNGAFPSQKRLCALTGYSRRTIQHGLHDLEASGLIVKGDQRLTEHYGRHRPIVWNLTMEDFRGAKTAPLKKNESEAQHTTPQNSQGAQLGAQKTAVRGAIRGAISLRPNLYKEESYIEPRESNARARKPIPIPADWKPSEEHRRSPTGSASTATSKPTNSATGPSTREPARPTGTRNSATGSSKARNADSPH